MLRWFKITAGNLFSVRLWDAPVYLPWAYSFDCTFCRLIGLPDVGKGRQQERKLCLPVRAFTTTVGYCACKTTVLCVLYQTMRGFLGGATAPQKSGGQPINTAQCRSTGRWHTEVPQIKRTLKRVQLRIVGLCLIPCISGLAVASENVILVLGDSLSAGYGIDIEQSWTVLLQSRLAAAGYAYRVENASISGDTTSGGAARLPQLLRRHAPAVVVVELGANDGLRGVQVAETERNFHKMFKMIAAAGAATVLLEMRVPPNLGPAYAEQFDQLFARLGDRADIRLVPFFLHDVFLNRALMQKDGLHPNAKAQPKMLENVWVYLQDELY